MSKQITVPATQDTQGQTREIQIKCQGADALPIDTLVDFQGKLKKLTKKNAEKLSRSIEQEFIDPIKVWQHEGFNKIINGHQRLRVLCALRESGWNIPLIPVDYVFPKDEAEAREWVLKLDSQYGEFDNDELKIWLNELDKSDREMLRLLDTKKQGDSENKKNGIVIKNLTNDQIESLIMELSDKGYDCKSSKRISDENIRERVRLINEIKRTGMNATEFVKDKCCEICGMTNNEHIAKYNERLHIHHKDNNGRRNIRLGEKPIHENLQILCRSCHVRADNKARVNN